MGRQLQLDTTQVDDAMLIQFVATLAPIRVFQSHTRTQEELWIPEPETCGIPPWILYIWPQTFPWTPTYQQTGGPDCPPESAGFFYIANKNVAPILELTRSDITRQQYGRIYWGSNFSAPNGLAYDEVAFSRFVDSVWRYIRKFGTRPKGGKHSPYFLPDAAKSNTTRIA
jgi:hypothetical protein